MSVHDAWQFRRYVYTEPTPGCRELLAVANTESNQVHFTTDRTEFPIESKSRGTKHAGKYQLCGVECYLVVHHGLLRVRPVPSASSPEALRTEWHWSKELLRLSQNSEMAERNLLCLSASTRQYVL